MLSCPNDKASVDNTHVKDTRKGKHLRGGEIKIVWESERVGQLSLKHVFMGCIFGTEKVQQLMIIQKLG
jgi:hypothetical protein